MSLTFSLRKEIVKVVPMVSEVLERWPALFIPNEVKVIVITGESHQIGYEFKRITNVDLLEIQIIVTPTYTTTSEVVQSKRGGLWKIFLTGLINRPQLL
ncbi:uncharacterized protein LOC124395026 [Tachysurus ichikawai]